MRIASIGLAAGFTLSILVACQKEQINTENAGDSIALGHAKSAGMDLQWEPDNSGNGDHKCPPDGNKCEKITFLNERDKGTVDRVLDIISGGDYSKVSEVFNEEQAVLAQFIPQSLINDVIAGTSKPTTVKNSSTGERFIVFGETPYEKVYAIK